MIVAASNAGYIAAGYIATAVALAGYAARTLLRGRSLSQKVPPDERRWT